MRHGRRARHRLLHVAVRPNGLPQNRYGYAVGKRVGGAVIRNRTRRRLREALRTLPLATGYDILIVAHPPAADVSFGELHTALTSTLRRTSVLISEPSAHETAAPA